MQIVQKIFIECQEMVDMKIKKGNFWFNSKKYNIVDGNIVPETTPDQVNYEL